MTLDDYCKSECVTKDNIDNIFVTGGSLKIGSSSGKNLMNVLMKDLEKSLAKYDYPFAQLTRADDPQAGSVLNGARIMFAMP